MEDLSKLTTQQIEDRYEYCDEHRGRRMRFRTELEAYEAELRKRGVWHDGGEACDWQV